MEANAYTLGTLDAGINYGLAKEAWAKAIMPLAGAAMGAALAPEGEGTQGAVLGGLGALGMQSAALAGARGVKNAFTPKPVAPVARPAGVDPAALAAKQQEINAFRSRAAMPPSKPTVMASTIPAITPETKYTSQQTGADPAMVTAMHASGPPGTQMQHIAPPPNPISAVPSAQPPMGTADNQAIPAQPIPQGKKKKGKQQIRVASLDEFKIGIDLGLSIPVAGGIGLGVKDQRERLPGMGRWVPRSAIERGFNYADDDASPEDVAESEASRGVIGHPLLGAALAAAGARKFLPNSGLMGPLLSGVAGLGLGAAYHHATKDRRVEEGMEAYQGASRERERFPVQRHPSQTANESTPLAVSRGDGNA